MRNNTKVSMSNIVGEIQQRKYALMGPAKAAAELSSLLSQPELSDFESRRRIAMVGSHLKLPTDVSAHLPAARRCVLWAWTLQAITLKQAPRGTRLFEEGAQGEAIFYLLTGRVRLETPLDDTECIPEVWQPVGEEALAGDAYKYGRAPVTQ
jgi:hypothetical protein